MLFCLCLLSHHTVPWPLLISLFYSLCLFSCSFFKLLKLDAKLFFLAVPHSLWDLSSQTRGQTWAPCSESTGS